MLVKVMLLVADIVGGLLCTNCSTECDNSPVRFMESECDPVVALMNNLEHRFASTYSLCSSGITLGTPEGIVELLGFEFQKRSERPLSVEDSRRLLVAMSTEFIDAVNKSRAVHQLLGNYPFCISNITLTVFLKNENGYDRDHPELSVIRMYDGMLIYESWAPDPEFILKTVTSRRETYEEAKAILERENGAHRLANTNTCFREVDG